MSIIEKAVDRLSKDDHDVESPVIESPVQSEPDVIARAAAAQSAAVQEEFIPTDAQPKSLSRNDTTEISIYQLGLPGVISPDSERSRTAEEFRIIKRPLLQGAFAQNSDTSQHANLIMVTSAIAGEGKTFTALNLAISVAMEMDRTVLLVDADVARPGLSRILRIDDRAGFIDCLGNVPGNLGKVMLRTDVPKLTVVPAGSRDDRSTELLGSNSMRHLLNEIALRYPDRIVLFDSPPLLETSEASVLANQMGKVVVVVESAVTSQYLVKEAIAQVDSVEKVSLVLNKTYSSMLFSRYAYGYSYGYGYGDGQQGERDNT
jgi:receptor protein-tyrosine kinase